METGFLNLHDDERFAALPSPLYDQDILDDSAGSLFNIIRDGFPYEVAVTRNYDASDFWGTEQELNGDMAVLPLAVPPDGKISKINPRNQEDFQKMLTDWQEHIGSLQASDSEDMDVKDIVGLDMVLPKPLSENLPDDLFEDETKPFLSPKKLTSPNKIAPKSPAVLGISIKSELSLDNFMECEDEEEPGKKVVEDDAVDTVKEETLTDIKIEVEEDCVDVETVSEQIPVLEAKDLTSLLEQFEASEAFNTSSNTKPKPSVLDTHLYAMATQQIPTKSITSTMSPKSCTSVLSHQSIKDSLPKEVIDRIKASGRKKVIPVIPAMPSRRIVRGGTRMQDAGAALSRNKLLKIVSGGGSGESVQLDHDYCTLSTNDIELAPPPRSFYHSDASEYSLDKSSDFQENGEDKVKSQEDEKIYSRLPDYYTVLAPQKVIEKNDSRSRKVNVRDEESWGENNSKKDSGLESGEVSDASEEIIASPSESIQQLGNRSVKKTINLKTSSKNSILSSSAKTCSNVLSVNGKDYHIASTNINSSKIADNIQNISKKPGKEMTMVSVLKKCQVANVSKQIGSSSGANSDTVPVSEVADTKEEKQGPKKRKLNIQEYRSRLKELDRIRGSRENSRANSPISSQTCTVSVGTSMMEDAASDMKDCSSNSQSVAENNTTPEPVISIINQKDSLNRPEMQSVEVQTLPENEVPTMKGTEKEKKEARNRERRRRQYRSRRATSSSSNESSCSSSSSSSRNFRRRRANSRSTQRRRRSWRRSSPGLLSSSSVSRGHSIWSRSPSSDSNGSSCSSYSSRSRSRSRSSGAKSSRRSPSSRKWHHYEVHDRDYRRSGRNYTGSCGWRRSRSPMHRKNLVGDWQLNEREKQRQVEERRVIYVGRIEEGTSKAELRKRFEAFGPIVDISVHFREHGDNYGFVTYRYKVDAYDAVEHGNDNPNLPHYDLCFGGRRAFCKTRYADLDGMATKNDPLANSSTYSRAPGNAARSRSESEDFDVLLREAKATIRKRKA